MKFNSKESVKVLKYAVEKEKAAEVFYTEKSQTVLGPGASEIFRDIARDEHKHFEIVNDLLKQAESGSETPTIILPSPSNPKERVEEVFIKFKDSELQSLSEKTTAKEALTFALEIEKLNYQHAENT